jgi:hypothetical protein
VIHAPPGSSSSALSFKLFLARRTSYEVPHNVVVSSLLLFCTSSIQIFSAPFCKISSVKVHLLMPEIKFHTHKKLRYCIKLYRCPQKMYSLFK